MNLDDLKVSIASVTGLGSFLVDMDLVVMLMISLASLCYITLKIRELLNKR